MPRRPARQLTPPPEFDDHEREAVLAVNRAFYRVASDRDFEAMDQLWAPTGPVFCFHPGQAPLLDRRSVMASWQAILRHPTSPRVRSADEMVIGQVGLAIVLCREIMPNLQLIATNTFVRQSARWHIIGHQSGVVPAVQRTQAGTAATPSTRDRRKLH